jgi:hypothetical protein
VEENAKVPDWEIDGTTTDDERKCVKFGDDFD